MKGSLIVVAFFVLGLFVGHSGCLPSWFMSSQTSFVALCALLLFVGMGIGLNPNMMRDIKSLSPRLALLPLVTILGSWMGAVVAYVVMSSDLCTLLAVEHLHNRISRRRTGHHRPSCQHRARDDNPSARPHACQTVRAVGSHHSWRRHDHGHHATHHSAGFGPEICGAEHLPRLRDRLLRAVPRYNVVHHRGIKQRLIMSNKVMIQGLLWL